MDGSIMQICLLVAWAALLFGGFIFGKPMPSRRMPTWTRMASSFALVVSAWIWFLMVKDQTLSPYGLLIAIGMTFGFIGDLFMAKLLNRVAALLPMKEPVIGGILSFGLGHIAYIAGILWLTDKLNALDSGVRLGAWIIWLLAGLIGWYVVVYRSAKTRSPLHFAALGYALLLSSTAGVATGLALQNGQFAPLALGAALFLISDLILAGELFSGLKFPLLGDVVWLTYGPAQALIVFSMSVAIKLFF